MNSGACFNLTSKLCKLSLHKSVITFIHNNQYIYYKNTILYENCICEVAYTEQICTKTSRAYKHRYSF